MQLARADLAVDRSARIYEKKRQIASLNFVAAPLDLRDVGIIMHDDCVSGFGAESELPRARLIVRVTEAASDAGPVYSMGKGVDSRGSSKK
jgi:hypothetical protein